MRAMRNVAAVPRSFGERLYSLRIDRGLTQTDLAAPHYTKQFVSMLEGGRARPSLEALEHFAKRLSVSTPELLGLDTVTTHGLLAEIQRRVGSDADTRDRR